MRADDLETTQAVDVNIAIFQATYVGTAAIETARSEASVMIIDIFPHI